MSETQCKILPGSHFVRRLVACVEFASFTNLDEAIAQTSGQDPISLTHSPVPGQQTGAGATDSDVHGCLGTHVRPRRVHGALWN